MSVYIGSVGRKKLLPSLHVRTVVEEKSAAYLSGLFDKDRERLIIRRCGETKERGLRVAMRQAAGMCKLPAPPMQMPRNGGNMKIVVLAGGYSPEREVSLSSGSLIANALMENGHAVLLLDLYLGKPEAAGKSETELAALFRTQEDGARYAYRISEREPDLAELKRSSGNGESLIGPCVIELCRAADRVFLALHGDIGENGKLQAVLDCFGISYTGSGYIGSLLAMNKDLAKKLMARAGILTPAWQMVSLSEAGAAKTLPLPCVIKPVSCGSSVGVTLVRTHDALAEALAYAGKYETQVLVEELIVGRELSVGILEGTALPIIEIIPKEGFYDYSNKYQAGGAREVCPAQLPEETALAIQAAAKQVHEVLELGVYSRVDFLLTEDGTFYCLEANTLPGMTPTSLLPQEAAAVGISYHDLCEKLIRA